MAQDRTWRKSTYSGGSGDSDCVEVSLAQDALVRDSKNAGGAVLAFSADAWHALVGQIKAPS
ncbi:DUF397 domain-containing protein [Lentzea sp. PSKA42]|uniref:DUF397 domain-containing protein n=1 Tax=Lentzea indica TaxID=2604800 RepID=A0ABX1F9J0_9PSEU|nr:DUF397 domain-containing protein [Lentzea indica]NKE55497.1 DUF397 domain-containing protein [Lentzea indica]